MTPTFGISPRVPTATAPIPEVPAPTGFFCTHLPLHLTASTAIASLLAGTTACVLAYASGMDASISILTGIAVFAGGGLLWLAENFSLMRQQQFMHATMQHVVFNGVHTAVSGLLGHLPASLGAQQLACQFGTAPAAARNATISAGKPAALPEISRPGFAVLLGAVALPTFLIFLLFSRALASGRQNNAATDALAEASDNACKTPAGSRALRTIYDVAVPLIASAALVAAPACALQEFSGSENAVRFLVFCAGNLAGASLREILNQSTARAWISIRREGTGYAYGLSSEIELERPWSTLVPTAGSIALFTASSAMFVALTNVFPELQLVPAGASILSLPATEFARRLCMRQLAVNAPAEMFEALWRYLPLGAYAAIRKIPLEYRRTHGCGLLHSVQQWARHVTDTDSYKKAAAFASLRIGDGSLVNALNLMPYCQWAAPLIQGMTMVRTPFLAAHVLHRLVPDCEDPLDVVTAIPPIAQSDDATARNPDAAESGCATQDPSSLKDARAYQASSFIHTYV